jgi:hypothetical protein
VVREAGWGEGKGTQGGEVAEVVEAAGEDAGVDGASDGCAPADLGHHGSLEDLGDVGRPQAASGFVEDDHAVVALPWGRQEAAEGQVARAPHHDVALVYLGALRGFQAAPVVYDDELGGRRHGTTGEGERGCHDHLLHFDAWDGYSEQGGHRPGVSGDKPCLLVSGAVEGESGGNRAGSVPAPGAGDADDPFRHAQPPLHR